MDPRMLGMFGNAFPDGLPGWETVVGALQHVQSAPNAATAAAGMCGVEMAVNMSANQPLSQAAWKKLIQKDKVGRVAGTSSIQPATSQKDMAMECKAVGLLQRRAC
jgi:hypothetical protein